MIECNSEKKVLEILPFSGGVTHADIVSASSYSPRTIRYALSKLIEKGMIQASLNMRDMRQKKYTRVK